VTSEPEGEAPQEAEEAEESETMGELAGRMLVFFIRFHFFVCKSVREGSRASNTAKQ
jgi:hypothetical protein